MPYRNEKLQELLHRDIAGILERDFMFPGALLTVTGARISPDHTHASVSVSVFPEKVREKALTALEKFVFCVQQTLNERLRIHPVPKIRFVLDSSQERTSRLYELIKSTHVSTPPARRTIRKTPRDAHKRR